MADKTKIEWTDSTWNIITGCSVVSAGCKHCYAMKLAGTRLQHHPSRAGLTIDTAAGPVWNGQVRFNEQWLDQPLRWRRTRRIFVCAHGDLFHESVPDEWIDRVFAIMALAPQHTFQVLTKRPERMLRYFTQRGTKGAMPHVDQWAFDMQRERGIADARNWPAIPWPLPNVWLGVSVENQDAANERIPLLLQTPAVVRWISAEPLLGPVDLKRAMWSGVGCGGCHQWGGDPMMSSRGVCHACKRTEPEIRRDHGFFRTSEMPRIDWVVTGGESGPRPMHPDWARSLRDQCAAARVPFLFKQWGDWAPSSEPTPAFNRTTRDFETVPAGRGMLKVGKKAAGRLLDGVLHDAYPEVRHG